jgi:hypothetical protein
LIRQLADATAFSPHIYFFSKITANEHDRQLFLPFNKKDLAVVTNYS